MKTETTLQEILESDLMNEIIEQQDADLKEAGFTYKEIKSLADYIIKNKKNV